MLRCVSIVLLGMLLTACELPQGESKITLPEPESPGAKLVKKFCSDCHAPPSPKVHTAKEWPNVIYRMQEHRRMNAYSPMLDHELEQMLDYLQQFAKSE